MPRRNAPKGHTTTAQSRRRRAYHGPRIGEHYSGGRLFTDDGGRVATDDGGRPITETTETEETDQ